MATHLDLEEQEQLDQIKHFWNKYGNLITGVAIVVIGAIAAWNGWSWWQNRQALQASALFSEVERAAQAGDTARVQRAFDDIRSQFGSTTYAQQAGLLAVGSVESQVMGTDAMTGRGPDRLPRRQLAAQGKRLLQRVGAPAAGQPLGQQGLQTSVVQFQLLG